METSIGEVAAVAEQSSASAEHLQQLVGRFTLSA
jgi:hypothetical protein